jgi:hypothetical protein
MRANAGPCRRPRWISRGLIAMLAGWFLVALGSSTIAQESTCPAHDDQSPHPTTAAGVTPLARPPEFHGGCLVGYSMSESLQVGDTTLRPTAGQRFVSLILEVYEPFGYVPGRFRELTLTDSSGRIYQWRGFPSYQGFAMLDDIAVPPGREGEPVLSIEYPIRLAIPFEVPASVTTVRLAIAGRDGTWPLPLS